MNMVRVEPEVESQPVEAWPPDAPESDVGGEQRWGADGGSEDQSGELPAEGGPRSGGGGRFWRRDRARQPRGDGDKADLRNTWQVVAGSVLVPLGVAFILMAWYGAAHTAYVQQQIPYLVSGSFAGVGCMVLGGLLYWAHWLYRLYDQADQHHEEQLKVMMQTLRVLVERLPGASDGQVADFAPSAPGAAYGTPSDVMGSYSDAPGAGWAPAGGDPAERPGGALPNSLAPGPGGTSGGSYVLTPSGSVYHHPSCPIIAHHSEGLRVLGSGAVVGMEPCRICLPGVGSP